MQVASKPTFSDKTLLLVIHSKEPLRLYTKQQAFKPILKIPERPSSAHRAKDMIPGNDLKMYRSTIPPAQYMERNIAMKLAAITRLA